MESLLQTIVSNLIVVVEASGALVLMIGVIRSLVGYVRQFVFLHNTRIIRQLRMSLGQSMVLALEFQVAADILKTSLSPTWQDMLRLGATIALRTVLNYLLERELAILESGHPELEDQTFPPSCDVPDA
ncbi:MAG: DUF1622 domain-containing protein [Anaerolineae bacterium]|nr:DUF1622 domain-containing protein [Anaerolineae bacterium]